MDITATVFQDQGADVIEVEPDGDSEWARLLDAVWVGDWMSLVLAEKANVDPVDIRFIDHLKNTLRQPLMTKRVQVRDLGLMDYKPCWDLQEEVFHSMVNTKIARRNAGLNTTEPAPEVGQS